METITRIGEKRATAIIALRKEKKRGVSLEDVKQITTSPSTIWDPLVEDGSIHFGAPNTNTTEKGQTKQTLQQAFAEIRHLNSEIDRKIGDK